MHEAAQYVLGNSGHEVQTHGLKAVGRQLAIGQEVHKTLLA